MVGMQAVMLEVVSKLSRSWWSEVNGWSLSIAPLAKCCPFDLSNDLREGSLKKHAVLGLPCLHGHQCMLALLFVFAESYPRCFKLQVFVSDSGAE